MKMILLIGVALLVSLFANQSQAADVLVFGDSWGTYGREAFEDMFKKRNSNLEVLNRAIGGTTAKSWAEDPNCLLNMLDENPEVQYIWLTIGGNDGIYELLEQVRPVSVIAQEAQRAILSFLEPAIAAYPHVKIVQFGYDIVDFSGLVCGALSLAMLPECVNRKNCINEATEVLQLTVDLTCEANSNQHTCLNLRGSMQEGSGEVPGPYPNEAYFSPTDLMEDCIHPKYEGFDIIFDNMWEQYWSKEIKVQESIRSDLRKSNRTLAWPLSRNVTLNKRREADKRLVDSILRRAKKL
jgi:lysophospholipase L1-like esterase